MLLALLSLAAAQFNASLLPNVTYSCEMKKNTTCPTEMAFTDSLSLIAQVKPVVNTTLTNMQWNILNVSNSSRGDIVFTLKEPQPTFTNSSLVVEPAKQLPANVTRIKIRISFSVNQGNKSFAQSYSGPVIALGDRSVVITGKSMALMSIPLLPFWILLL